MLLASSVASGWCSCSAGRLRTGVEIIQELQSANERRFAELLNPDKSQRLARIYDRYNFVLQMQRKLDFDDLLHHFLALVHHHPEVSQCCGL